MYNKLVVLLVTVAFLLSCGAIKEPDLKGIGQITVERIGLERSILNFDLVYFNPNRSRLRLKTAEGDAWINEEYLGHFTVDTLVEIPSQSDFNLPVRMELDMTRLLKKSVAFFFNKEVMVRITGMARIGKGGIFINYPIRYEGKQDTEKLLNSL